MPKRTSAEKIERYKRKIQILEQDNQTTKNKRRRRKSVFPNSSDDDQDDVTVNITSPNEIADLVNNDNHYATWETQEHVTLNESTQPVETSAAEIPLAETMPAVDPMNPGTAEIPPPLQPELTVDPALDPALLAALGELTSDGPEFGMSIHDSLANLWLPLLKKGLTRENREKLLKEYLIPGNCKLLQAPKLNAEVSSAVSEVIRGRDKKYLSVQQQLGHGVTAVNRAMDILLKSDNKTEALKYLSDSCRILSDLHFFFTKDRTKLITPSLDKNFLHIIQDAERDDTLLGCSLSEKIKASKAIEKQGQQIKKTTGPVRTQNMTSTRAPTAQGNWSGPPRYSSNRGGRGGNRKTNPLPTTRRPYVTTAIQPRPTAQNKARAPANHH